MVCLRLFSPAVCPALPPPQKTMFPAENVLIIIDAWATSNKKWGMQVGGCQ